MGDQLNATAPTIQQMQPVGGFVESVDPFFSALNAQRAEKKRQNYEAQMAKQDDLLRELTGTTE